MWAVDRLVMRGAQWVVDRLADRLGHYGLAAQCMLGGMMMAAADGMWLWWRAAWARDWLLLGLLVAPFPLLFVTWYPRLRLYRACERLERLGDLRLPEVPLQRLMHLCATPGFVLLAVLPKPDGPVMCWLTGWLLVTAALYFADCKPGTPRRQHAKGHAWQHS